MSGVELGHMGTVFWGDVVLDSFTRHLGTKDGRTFVQPK